MCVFIVSLDDNSFEDICFIDHKENIEPEMEMVDEFIRETSCAEPAKVRSVKGPKKGLLRKINILLSRMFMSKL